MNLTEHERTYKRIKFQNVPRCQVYHLRLPVEKDLQMKPANNMVIHPQTDISRGMQISHIEEVDIDDLSFDD